MHGDVVVEDRTVLSGYGFDMHDMESLVFKLINGAREDIVSFALEFGRGVGRALICRERGGIEAVRVGLTGGVFRFELDFGAERGSSLGLIVEPACRSDQHKQNNQNHGQIVRPTAALIRPENGADACSPYSAHVSE